MPVYQYETIPADPSEKSTIFEFKQSMNDVPLAEHPETGQPVRRVISGGISVSPKKGSGSSGNCCSPGSSCCA